MPCCQQQLIPAGGVYAVRVEWGDGQRSRGIMNIGTRPTFGSHPQTLEVHLLDYSGNLTITKNLGRKDIPPFGVISLRSSALIL